MLDRSQTEQPQLKEPALETYDLVVVGAGIAGLNALYAASEYLQKGAKVLLIDEKQAPGGMWNTAYDYVRLHQPHPMFTVGNMKWNWNKTRDYLAKRDEVQAHLSNTLGSIATKVSLEMALEHTVLSVEEVLADGTYRAKIDFGPNDAGVPSRTALARQAIHAPGLNYQVSKPLTLSSTDVISVTPQDLTKALRSNPVAPVVVVGGGKTGMDSVLTVLDENPKRKIILINGRGTNFLNRTKYLPTGAKRWTSGALASRLFRDLALNFDGYNEEDTLTYFRRTHSTDTSGENGVFLYGLLSEEEHAKIEDGLSEKHEGYLQDVTPGAKGAVVTLRGGKKFPIEAGTIFVNCTGSFYRGPTMATVFPMLSQQKTVLSINMRDGFHFLTSVAAFFLTHLLYRGELTERGFYRLDHEALFRENRNAWVGASASQAYLNQLLAVQTLPLMLLDRCGLDLDRWYPFPRRMAGLLRMKATAEQDGAHCRRSLERVSQRFNVRCETID